MATQDRVYGDERTGEVVEELTLTPDDLREAMETGRVTLRRPAHRAREQHLRGLNAANMAERWDERQHDRYVPRVAIVGGDSAVVLAGGKVAILEDDGEG